MELPEAVVRRGFVEHVTAPSFVLGAMCVECPEEGPCRRCYNLGTALDRGLADLFARQPVTSTTLPDLRPERDWGEDDEAAVWSDSAHWGGSEDDSVVPSPLFESLDEFIDEADGRKVFPTVAVARRAASQAVVTLGRRLVGLPPVPATDPPPNTRLEFEYEPVTPVLRFGVGE